MLNLMASLQVSVPEHVFYFLVFSAPNLLFCLLIFPLDVKSYSESMPHGRVYAEVYQPDVRDIILTWGTVIYNTLPLTLCKSLTSCYIS